VGIRGGGGFGGQVAQTMCINVSKCKNNKIKGGKKKEAEIRRITVQSQAISL
jgi:hypothetical protein